MRRGLIVAAAHIVLVFGVAGKLLYDRSTLPRGWVQTEPYGTELPVRGRYVQLKVNAPIRGATDTRDYVAFTVEDGYVIAVATDRGIPAEISNGRAILYRSIAYFIPEHVPDPSARAAGDELWAEVTIPKQGLPRPIRLGVRRNGKLIPLDLE
jgi:hypothetical protein